MKLCIFSSRVIASDSSPSVVEVTYPGWIPIFHFVVSQHENSLPYPLIFISPCALLPTSLTQRRQVICNTDKTKLQHRLKCFSISGGVAHASVSHQGRCHFKPHAVHTLLVHRVVYLFLQQDLIGKLKSDCSVSENWLILIMDKAHHPIAGQCLRTTVLHRQNTDHSSLFLTSAHFRSSPTKCQLTGVKNNFTRTTGHR